MKIFNTQLNGLDAKWFCKLPKQEKIDWIVNNTNQTNLETINNFLLQPIDDSDCGCGCGGSNIKKNESNRISEETIDNIETVNNSGNNSKVSTSRRKQNKNT